MNVLLPRQLEEYVAQLVQTSGYNAPDEAVTEALREHQLRRQVRMTPELEKLLDEGLEDSEHAKTTEQLRRS